MKITFDAAKDEKNRAKHGLSLSLAAQVDWYSVEAIQDRRADYGEERYVALAPINNRLHVVVFVIRDDSLRIISLRKANNRELQHYEKQAQINCADRI